MRNARAWLLGLPILIGLWWASLAVKSPEIAADLRGRSEMALKSGGQDWAKIAIAGRDAAITSPAPTAETRTRARDLVAAELGVRRVAGDGGARPAITPYVWRAEKTASGLTLGGHVPDAATGAAVIAAAAKAAAGAAPVSRMELGDGAPARLGAHASYALSLLGRMTTGDAVLTDGTLAVNGIAATREDYDAIAAALKSPPEGIKLGAVAIRAPIASPYVWAIEKSGNDVRVSGYAPNDAARAANNAAARKIDAAFKDEQKLASGEPPSHARAVQLALEAVKHLADGKVEVKDGVLSLSGAANSSEGVAALERLGAEARAAGLNFASQVKAPPLREPVLPPPPEQPQLDLRFTPPPLALFQLPLGPSPELPPPPFAASEARTAASRAQASPSQPAAPKPQPAPEVAAPRAPQAAVSQVIVPPPVSQAPQIVDCGTRLREAVAGRTITFATSMRYIRDEDRPLIASIAETLRRCGKVSVSIEGHTDSVGGVPLNQLLSENRAAQVVKAIAEAGAPGVALTSSGFGESRPVASNRAEEGRAKNRRVEIIIR